MLAVVETWNDPPNRDTAQTFQNSGFTPITRPPNIVSMNGVAI